MFHEGDSHSVPVPVRPKPPLPPHIRDTLKRQDIFGEESPDMWSRARQYTDRPIVTEVCRRNARGAHIGMPPPGCPHIDMSADFDEVLDVTEVLPG